MLEARSNLRGLSENPAMFEAGQALVQTGGLILSSQDLLKGDFRIDASYYSSNSFRARKVLAEGAFLTKPLQSYAKEMFNLPRFRRIWAEKGLPYMNPAEMFEFELRREKFVSPKSVSNANRFMVEQGWILITCSGIPGRLTLATKSLTDFFLSHDVIRLVPYPDELVGYVACVLSTWMGQALITQDTYGHTVDHIEPAQIENLPIPQLPDETQRRIHSNITKAHELREKGRELLASSGSMLQEQIFESLPKEDERAFTIGSGHLNERLDASYHNPTVVRLTELLTSRMRAYALSEKAKVTVAPRFKRVYVEGDMGVPFLQGSHISMTRPIDMKYLSKLTPGLSRWIVEEGWVLVTCSGTLGRVSLVPSAWDGWAVSQHALRIKPGRELDSGFLAAFLMSDWGRLQVLSKTYGGVVDEIDEAGMNEVRIPQVEDSVQKVIGQKAREAFELRERANIIESGTIRTLEDLLEKSISKENLGSYDETFELLGNAELEVGLGITEEKLGRLRPWQALRKETGLDDA
jgi:type I restriction enzyme S subunit